MRQTNSLACYFNGHRTADIQLMYCTSTPLSSYNATGKLHFSTRKEGHNLAFSQEFFSGGGKSIVMQISIVILLFSDQISGRGKSFQGGQTASGGRPPPPLLEKASVIKVYALYRIT